jgi:hypothetical protein
LSKDEEKGEETHLSVLELFRHKNTPAEVSHLKRLNNLHDKLEWQRQRENEIADDASLLVRTSHDSTLTDEFVDILFDSDRRKLRIINALRQVSYLIHKEEAWQKVMQHHPTAQPGE